MCMLMIVVLHVVKRNSHLYARNSPNHFRECVKTWPYKSLCSTIHSLAFTVEVGTRNTDIRINSVCLFCFIFLRYRFWPAD